MERIAIHIPEVRPDGSPVPAAALASFEERLYDIASEAKRTSACLTEEGFTILTGMGAWRSPSGHTFREPVRLYCLDVAEARSVLASVFGVADGIRVALEQESIYVTISPIEAMVVTELVAA
jgi:hypothetical protein